MSVVVRLAFCLENQTHQSHAGQSNRCHSVAKARIDHPILKSRHLLCVQTHLQEVDAKKAPAPGWDTIKYMIAVVQYGGRITDEYDKLLMDTIAERYFQQVAPRQCADIQLA